MKHASYIGLSVILTLRVIGVTPAKDYQALCGKYIGAIIQHTERGEVAKLEQLLADKVYILESELDRPDDFNYQKSTNYDGFRNRKGNLYRIMFSKNGAKTLGFTFPSLKEVIANRKTVEIFADPAQQKELQGMAVTTFGGRLTDAKGNILSIFLSCNEKICALKSFYYTPAFSM